jgi:hypothetical protein
MHALQKMHSGLEEQVQHQGQHYGQDDRTSHVKRCQHTQRGYAAEKECPRIDGNGISASSPSIDTTSVLALKRSEARKKGQDRVVLGTKPFVLLGRAYGTRAASPLVVDVMVLLFSRELLCLQMIATLWIKSAQAA